MSKRSVSQRTPVARNSRGRNVETGMERIEGRVAGLAHFAGAARALAGRIATTETGAPLAAGAEVLAAMFSRELEEIVEAIHDVRSDVAALGGAR